MIFVRDDNGLIQVESWDCLQYSGNIHELILTDGQRFYRSLSGFNKYYAEKEACHKCITSGLGGVTNGQSSTWFTRESIYGIMNTSKAREELVTEFNAQLKELIKHNPPDMPVRLKALKVKHDVACEKLSEKEVIRHSLICDTEMLALKDCTDMNHSICKQGMADMKPLNYFIDLRNI